MNADEKLNHEGHKENQMKSFTGHRSLVTVHWGIEPPRRQDAENSNGEWLNARFTGARRFCARPCGSEG